MPLFLDVAIGTVFIFLLFSLVIAALNEYLLSLFDQRAKFLRLGLAEIFGKVGKIKISGMWGKYMELRPEGEQFLAHGLTKAYSRSDSGGKSPSYLPAGAFVTALLDMIGGQGTTLTIDSRQIAMVSTFLAELQGAKPVPGCVYTFGVYDRILDNFLTALAAEPPTAGSPLALLKDKVDDGRARAAALTQLLELQPVPPPNTAADLASAQAIFDKPENASFKVELQALLKQAEDSVPKFQQALRRWFSLEDNRTRLELAAIHTLADVLRTTAGHTSVAIESGLKELKAINSDLSDSLLSLYRSVDGDMRRFKIAVEGWFNGVMDRVTGWYKNYAQKWMIVFGFVLAAILNVDTIRIVRELSKNPNLARAVSAQAETFSKGYKPQMTWEQLKKDIEEKLKPEQELVDKTAAAETEATQSAPIDKEKLASAQMDRQKAQAALEAKKEKLLAEAGDTAEAQFSQSVDTLKKTGIPMGWGDATFRQELGLDRIGTPSGLTGVAWLAYYPKVYTTNFGSNFFPFLAVIAGWFLTAIAASLGAPFWFDLLNRFVNIRAAGRVPGEKEATSTPTRPPPASLDTTPGTHAPVG